MNNEKKILELIMNEVINKDTPIPGCNPAMFLKRLRGNVNTWHGTGCISYTGYINNKGVTVLRYNKVDHNAKRVLYYLYIRYTTNNLYKQCNTENCINPFHHKEISRRETIIDLWNTGLYFNEIVHRLGINLSYVSRVINKARQEGVLND